MSKSASVRPSGSRRTKPCGNGTSATEQVQVAAYYQAERRGFAPGHELDDWLAAEAQLRAPAGKRA